MIDNYLKLIHEYGCAGLRIWLSMHIYPSGGHGWGIRDSFRYKAQWQDAVLDWLRRINE